MSLHGSALPAAAAKHSGWGPGATVDAEAGAADIPQPAGKASAPPRISHTSDKAVRAKRRGQGTEEQPNFLMGLGHPSSWCAKSQLVPTSAPAQLQLCQGQQHPMCAPCGKDASQGLLPPLSQQENKSPVWDIVFLCLSASLKHPDPLGTREKMLPSPCSPPDQHDLKFKVMNML